jgi:hypothetical protein
MFSMSDSDDDLLNTDFLGRSVLPPTRAAAAGVQNESFSIDALLARREALQRDAELAVGARRVGQDDAANASTAAAASSSTTTAAGNGADDGLSQALAAMRAAQTAAAARVGGGGARLLTPQSLCALNAFPIDVSRRRSPFSSAELGDFTSVRSGGDVGAGERVVRLELDALAVPSAMKTNELITSGALMHLLAAPPRSCEPAVLNALLLRVALERVDVLLATRCAELACRIVREDLCADWRPSIADVLGMFQLAGARAVVDAAAGTVLSVRECGGGTSVDAVGVDRALPVENVRLLCDVVALLAPRLVDDDTALLVRVLLTLLADARLGRVHDGAVRVLAALFDACAAANGVDAVVREVGGCCRDPATLCGVMRRLPVGSAGARLVTSRAAALALHALADGAVHDDDDAAAAAVATTRWHAADEAVRAGGAASASGSLVRFAVAQFGRSAAVPLRTQRGETSECVADCNWLMTCALLTDLCVSCDPNRLRGSVRQLERWCELLQARNAALHEDSFSPLLSLAKTQLGALRAKATMLATTMSRSAVRTIDEMMRQRHEDNDNDDDDDDVEEDSQQPTTTQSTQGADAATV